MAINFTKSNGNKTNRFSEHYLYPNEKITNDYIKAIRSVGEILFQFDSDKKVPIYGFGACLPDQGNKKD